MLLPSSELGGPSIQCGFSTGDPLSLTIALLVDCSAFAPRG